MYTRMASFSVISTLEIIPVKASMSSLLAWDVNRSTLPPLHILNIYLGYASDDQRFVHGSRYR